MSFDSAFRIARALDVVKDPRMMPRDSGIYLFLARGGDRLLALSGYFDQGAEMPLRWGGYDHLYTGKAYDLRTRLRHHLSGDCYSSTLRRTLVSLELSFLALSRVGSHVRWSHFDEAALTEWLLENCLIGFAAARDPERAEAEVLRATPSPLNINGRRARPYQKRLMEVRKTVFTEKGRYDIPSDAE